MAENVSVDASRHDKFHGEPSKFSEPPTVTKKEQTCVAATDAVTKNQCRNQPLSGRNN